MSQNYRKNKGGGGNWNRNNRKEKTQKIDSSDPVQVMFGEISSYLDNRHDKRERIVKLSRDITIESKRIIFCLHRIKGEDDENRESILGEAETRLEEVRSSHWSQVGGELSGEDHHQYLRAYSPALQEWIEALTFFYFLKHNKIASFDYVCQQLVVEKKDEKEKSESEEDTENEVVKEMVEVTCPHSEYILGLADLTGELMRNAINALGAGNIDSCFTLLEILQSMAEGFGKMSKQDTPREFSQKLWTLKQSCKKVENACYAISVRGSEIPKNHWADIFTKKDDDRREEFDTNTDFFSD